MSEGLCRLFRFCKGELNSVKPIAGLEGRDCADSKIGRQHPLSLEYTSLVVLLSTFLQIKGFKLAKVFPYE